MSKIFVSYSRADLRKVRRITKDFEAYGLEFWMDTQNLQSGDDWTESLSRAISGCERFLLFMSVSSMSSDNVEREVHIAYQKKKKFIILRLDNAKVPPSMDYQLARIQWTDYLSPGWEAKIVSALGNRKYFQKIKSGQRRPKSPQLTRLVPKKPPKAQLIIAGLQRAFSTNGQYHEDQCIAALSKLDGLVLVVGSHWINPALAYKELVPRQYLLDRIDVLRALIQDFQATCPPGSSSKRQLIQDELKLLSQQLDHKANK